MDYSSSSILVATILLFAPALPLLASGGSDAAKRRNEISAAMQKGDSALPILQEALGDSNALVRRAATRALGSLGDAALPALEQAFNDDQDALVRRTAFRALILKESAGEPLAFYRKALADKDEIVRRASIEALVALPRTSAISSLLRERRGDPSAALVQLISQSLWPFNKEARSTRDSPEYQDTQLSVAGTLALADQEWRFQPDLQESGHEQGWFDTGFDDKTWKTIPIAQPWKAAGIDYLGIAWYRRNFELPEKLAVEGVDLTFEAVDESAWIWVNGHYVGQHDMGPSGWDKSFSMEIGPLLNWGGKNQITVRVSKRTGQHAGIWKPAYLEFLKK